MFPSYIIVRRRKDGKTSTNEAAIQWQGLVKEIKNDNMRKSELFKQEISKMRIRIERMEKGYENILN